MRISFPALDALPKGRGRPCNAIDGVRKEKERLTLKRSSSFYLHCGAPLGTGNGKEVHLPAAPERED
jgi:hypothetical protein